MIDSAHRDRHFNKDSRLFFGEEADVEWRVLVFPFGGGKLAPLLQ
jgi:hypothetical protein